MKASLASMFLILTSCAAQQSSEQIPQNFSAPVEQQQNKVIEEKEKHISPDIKYKFHEIDEQIDYLKRYIGPEK